MELDLNKLISPDFESYWFQLCGVLKPLYLIAELEVSAFLTQLFSDLTLQFAFVGAVFGVWCAMGEDDELDCISFLLAPVITAVLVYICLKFQPLGRFIFILYAIIGTCITVGFCVRMFLESLVALGEVCEKVLVSGTRVIAELVIGWLKLAINLIVNSTRLVGVFVKCWSTIVSGQCTRSTGESLYEYLARLLPENARDSLFEPSINELLNDYLESFQHCTTAFERLLCNYFHKVKILVTFIDTYRCQVIDTYRCQVSVQLQRVFRFR